MSLLSPWGEKLNKELPVPEYPRMLLQRGSYMCLNGVWDYQITDGSAPAAAYWQRITVPFAVGAPLSGVEDILQPQQTLWYRLHFPYEPSGIRTRLNFEAVDQCCVVYLNGKEAGWHNGGYEAFSLDITGMLQKHNELVVEVKDETDQGLWSFGKQRLEHGGMWYTPTAGIWGTVWIEELPDHAVQDIRILPDYDRGQIQLDLAGEFSQSVITIFAGKKLIHRDLTGQKHMIIDLPGFRSWSPEDPFLYDIYVQTEDDTVRSYFGMRKFSMLKDAQGHPRFALNNHPYVLAGLLDQGYSVDGLYTYPADAAMRYEIQQCKDLGFNLLRKHAKVENRRWYYYCDRIGMLVMQDIPNGGGPYDRWKLLNLPTIGFRKMKDDRYASFGRENPEGRTSYLQELDEIVHELSGCTGLCAWVPFNEGWGQFDSAAVTRHIRQLDPQRLVDSASGWHDNGAGDFDSRHRYFRPFHAHGDDERILLLSEFGGYQYRAAGHGQEEKTFKAYKQYTDMRAYSDAVLKSFEQDCLQQIPNGLSGYIYTQLSDVEEECNGLFTADRRLLKIDRRGLRQINLDCRRKLK